MDLTLICDVKQESGFCIILEVRYGVSGYIYF